jgi:hypothetical protein
VDPARIVEDCLLTERIVDVAFDDVARVVKERCDTVVGVLHSPQALVQRAVGGGVAVPSVFGRGGSCLVLCA